MKRKVLAYLMIFALVLGLCPITTEAAQPVKLSKKSVTLKITKTDKKTTYGTSTIKVKQSKLFQ